MTEIESRLSDDFGIGEAIGSHHYRAWVGPPEYYDRIGALQFSTLIALGMREDHSLADVGCGSLRGGRLSIMYLRPGNYCGIEPTAWALQDGKKAHLGEELIGMKQPTFSNDDNYTITGFGRQFDYVMVHSVFTHAPGNQIKRCLQQAREVMHSKSIFVATYLENDTDHVGEDFVYPWVTQFTREFITDAVTEAGLRCTHVDWPHPFDQRWFLATDPANELDLSRLTLPWQFSYENYLNDEIEMYGGTRQTYAGFLKADLERTAAERRRLPR